MGLTIYLLSIGLNGYLCAAMLQHKTWREFPAFFAYISFNAGVTLVLFGSYSHPVLYREIFIWGEIIVWILKGLIVGEIIGKVYGFKLAPRLAQFSGLLPSYSLLRLNLPLEQALGIGMAALLAILSFSKKDIPAKAFWIIVGLGGYHALSGISAIEMNVWPSVLTYVPTYAYSGALLLWIKAFRTQ
jgi:hypothetical protein